MGVDWRSIRWLEYQMMLAGWNEAQGTDETPGAANPEALSRLGRALEAHSVH